MSDDDSFTSLPDKIMALEIKKPSYHMFYDKDGDDNTDEKKFLSQYDNFDRMLFSFETLDVNFCKHDDVIIDPICNDFSGNMYKKVLSELPPNFKKLKETFKKENKESPKKYKSKDELSKIKEKWSKEIVGCLSSLYGFDAPKHPNCLSMQTRIKLRELIRLDRSVISRILVYIINKFAERLKASIHSRINSTTSKEITTITSDTIRSLTQLNQTIDKLFTVNPNYIGDYGLELYDLDNSVSSTKIISALNDAYEEMQRILIEAKTIYSIIFSHIRISGIPITYEDIHWRVFYESIYAESNLKATLYLYTESNSKEQKPNRILCNIATALHKVKTGWNEKISQLNSIQKQKLIDVLLFSDEFLKFNWEDSIYNSFNQPIVDIKDDGNVNEAISMIKRKKKSRRRKKKAKAKANEALISESAEGKILQEKEEPEQAQDQKESSEDDQCLQEANNKQLIKPNILPEKLSLMQAKYLARLKSTSKK